MSSNIVYVLLFFLGRFKSHLSELCSRMYFFFIQSKHDLFAERVKSIFHSSSNNLSKISLKHDYLLACSKPMSIFFKPLFRLSHNTSDLVCKSSWLPQSLSSRTRLSASPSKFNRWVSKCFILVSK